MKNRKIIFACVALTVFVLFCANASAAKVYFYEGKTSGNYKVSLMYSQFKNEIVKNGHSVEEMQAGLTKQALDTLKPDVIVMPNPENELTDDEATALFEYVTNEGKGLLICGGTQRSNKMTVPLGMRTTTEMLEDDNSRPRDSAGQRTPDKTHLAVSLPAIRADPMINSLTRGVSNLYFFGTYGIYVYGNAKVIISASESASTPKSLVFAPGSMPPVAAYARVGKGTVFLISDADMLSNNYVDQYGGRQQNLKFAANVVNWLSQPSTEDLTEDEVEIRIKAVSTENLEYNQTVKNLMSDKETLNGQVASISSQLGACQMSLTSCQNAKFMGIDYLIWAILVFAAAFVVAAIVIMKRGGHKEDDKKKGKKEDKGSLEYEFDTADDSGIGGGTVKEEDIEERLKELQKNTQ